MNIENEYNIDVLRDMIYELVEFQKKLNCITGLGRRAFQYLDTVCDELNYLIEEYGNEN